MHGIPITVSDDQLEDEVIDIFKEAKMSVHRKPLWKIDIQAVHRLKDKQTTIVKVVNRKFAKGAVICGRNLKDTKRYGNGKVYLNDSFCPEYKFLNYVVRKAGKDKIICRYKIRNGVNYVQKEPNGDFTEIGHVKDLENINIPVPEDFFFS